MTSIKCLMKPAIVLVAILSLTACGGGNSPTAPPMPTGGGGGVDSTTSNSFVTSHSDVTPGSTSGSDALQAGTVAGATFNLDAGQAFVCKMFPRKANGELIYLAGGTPAQSMNAGTHPSVLMQTTISTGTLQALNRSEIQVPGYTVLFAKPRALNVDPSAWIDEGLVLEQLDIMHTHRYRS